MDKHEIGCQINSISSSFCLAKWLQVTIDLVNGTTHSCHHPKRHHIPIEGLEENPSLLHNTPFKKEQRKKMLEGTRPTECVYCWKIEDTPGDHYSDRYIKSSDDWAYPHLERVKNLNWNEDINPTYVEVMFDNTCNFSCSYCLAEVSSSIYGEMKKFGPYPVESSDHRMYEGPLKRYSQEENPYIKAFWKWLPTLREDLEVLRITGGEPLLAKETTLLLEELKKTKFKKLSLSFNSNLCLPDKIIRDFKSRVRELLVGKKIKTFDLFASVDTFGDQAEYIRKGLDYSQFMENIETFCRELPEGRVIIMGTFGILSIPKFGDLLEQVLEMKRKFGNLIIDLSYLREPEYLRANLADEKLRKTTEENLQWMKNHQNNDGTGFSEHEVNKLARIVNWMNEKEDEKTLRRNRGDFFSFVNEYDRRYKMNFLEVFPEMRDFYILAKKEKFLKSF